MSYATVEKQIQSVPEEYLDEVSEYINYVLFKASKKREALAMSGTSGYFGCIAKPIDGLAIQGSMRDEWN